MPRFNIKCLQSSAYIAVANISLSYCTCYSEVTAFTATIITQPNNRFGFFVAMVIFKLSFCSELGDLSVRGKAC